MVQGRWYPIGSDIELPLEHSADGFGRGRDALDDQAQQVSYFGRTGR